MGQDRVDAWPSPQSFFPSPERKRENGVALCPEWPQPALWACALGKGLVTWPLWSRHFVSPILSPQPQSSISPSHCGHGLEGPRYLLPPPWELDQFLRFLELCPGTYCAHSRVKWKHSGCSCHLLLPLTVPIK
uniref:Uncharacterized protein n=1 Tax=Panthera leo TaxID=9689 RepID=A0A8C9D8A3_PANLE